MEKALYLFKSYLISQGLSKISETNYSSDLKGFLEWYTLRLKTRNMNINEEDVVQLVSGMTKQVLEDYVTFLGDCGTQPKTVNRRLSSLRRFASLAISQGWLSDNPTTGLRNTPTIDIKRYHENNKMKLIAEFKNDLLSEGLNMTTVKNYLVDVKQFFDYLTL